MSSPSEGVNVANGIINIVQKIAGTLDKIRFFKKEGQSIYIKIPEKICQYDAAIRVRERGVISKNINFPLPEIDCVTGTCMPSLFQLGKSIRKTPTGFLVSTKDIPAGTDLVLMQFQYKIPDSKFISNLVETKVAAEPLEFNERDEYWMHAQLRFPQILQKIYSDLKIQDVDLSVNVAVDNEVKTAIPKHVTRHLQLIRDMLAETERGKAHKLLLQHLQMKRRIGIDIYALINEISSIFLPSRFKNYIEIVSPFKYVDSRQGTASYNFPGQLVPKVMTVISQTDLSLQTPAVDGKLVYKKKNLLDKLTDVCK